ncbi:MAG TPA: hypothetical protein VJZ75_05475 [Candidatus Bathyarchaeia archaeon]|nr:hypothetical protein [Candidatus Bathyarchaeia archaeon]
MNRSLVLLTMGFVLSVMLISTVSGSTSVNQTSFFACNGGNWNQASNSGNLQINVCTPVTNYNYGGNQPSVQFAVYYNQASVASGGCSLGPCSNPTAVGVQNNSYLILRFYPGYSFNGGSGAQIIEPDSHGNAQQIWLPFNQNSQNFLNFQNYYNYPNALSCNPYFQFCFAQSNNYCNNFNSQSCPAMIFRIQATPITINVFFNQPY